MKGHPVEGAEGNEIFAEYLTRVRLAKLGYTSSFDDLSSFKAECFMIIDCEIDSTRSKEQIKGKKSGRRK